MSSRPVRLRVFAVEPTAAQVCWGSLPGGDIVLSAGDSAVTVSSDGRPGAVELTGLRPGTRYTLAVDGRAVSRFDTLVPPPGELVSRFATVSDLHIGEKRFGGVFRMG